MVKWNRKRGNELQKFIVGERKRRIKSENREEEAEHNMRFKKQNKIHS